MRQLFLLAVVCLPIYAQAPQPDGAGLKPGTLRAHWDTGGPDCASLAPWQVQAYNEDFYILRESGCTHYEKPFLYLIFGQRRVLLLDTGAGKPQTAQAVEGIIAGWAKRRSVSRESLELVVAHTHGHDDHTAGDPGFGGRPHTSVVPLTVEGTRRFFQIANWPEDKGGIDLGGRMIDVLPIPGHDPLSLAFYDAQTGILLTGDSLYPGRLYVADFPAFQRSIQRLVTLTATLPIAHVLGNHIEQSATPFLDYKVGTRYQPEEHELALTHAHILELNAALIAMGGNPVRLAMRDFTIWPK